MDLESLPPHSFHFDSFNAIFLLLSVCIDFSCCPELGLRLTCITADRHQMKPVESKNNLKDLAELTTLGERGLSLLATMPLNWL